MSNKVICHNRKGEEFSVDINKFCFRPSVYGLLIKDGRVLLSRQWDGYDFPGGGIDLGETLEGAVVREFWEETGLRVKPIRVLHAETSFYKPHHSNKNGQETYWNCQLIYFAVELIGGELSIANIDEFEKEYLDLPEWLDINNLADKKFKNSLGQRSVDLILKTALGQSYYAG